MSFLSKVLRASADELARLDARAKKLLSESVVINADELLPEWEAEYDLPSDGTDGQRVARAYAAVVKRQRFRPVDFQIALAALLNQDYLNVVVIETTRAQAAVMGDREIYRFYIYRDPNIGGVYYLDSAQAVVDDIKPGHTAGHVIESINFLWDDPFSLYDRDIYGV